MATTALLKLADGGTFPASSALASLASGAAISIGKVDLGNPAPFDVVLHVELSWTGGTLADLSAHVVEIYVGFATGTAGTFPDSNNILLGYVGSMQANTAVPQQSVQDFLIPVMDQGMQVVIRNNSGTALATSFNGASNAITYRNRTIALV